jgi:hypothetical protein
MASYGGYSGGGGGGGNFHSSRGGHQSERGQPYPPPPPRQGWGGSGAASRFDQPNPQQGARSDLGNKSDTGIPRLLQEVLNTTPGQANKPAPGSYLYTGTYLF